MTVLSIDPGVRRHVGTSPYAAEFEQLHAQHYRSLFGLAVLLGADDPEDLVCEAYSQLWPRMGDLRASAAGGPYLRRSVVNLCRKQQAHQRVVRRFRFSVAPERSAEDVVLADTRDPRILKALGQLSPRHREVLVLRYWLDMTVAAIAADLKVSIGTAKSHLSRGIATLSAVLAEEGIVNGTER